jgi:hypothetical protein
MFKPGSFYRSTMCRDVAFEVHKAFYVKEKGLWKLKVGWWNIGRCHAPWPMGIPQRIEVRDDQLSTFQRIAYNFRVPDAEFEPKFY